MATPMIKPETLARARALTQTETPKHAWQHDKRGNLIPTVAAMSQAYLETVPGGEAGLPFLNAFYEAAENATCEFYPDEIVYSFESMIDAAHETVNTGGDFRIPGTDWNKSPAWQVSPEALESARYLSANF